MIFTTRKMTSGWALVECCLTTGSQRKLLAVNATAQLLCRACGRLHDEQLHARAVVAAHAVGVSPAGAVRRALREVGPAPVEPARASARVEALLAVAQVRRCRSVRAVEEQLLVGAPLAQSHEMPSLRVARPEDAVLHTLELDDARLPQPAPQQRADQHRLGRCQIHVHEVAPRPPLRVAVRRRSIVARHGRPFRGRAELHPRRCAGRGT